MKSKILAEDRKDLVKLSRSLSPQQRLLAFLNHNQLLAQLSKAKRTNHANNSSRTIRASSR